MKQLKYIISIVFLFTLTVHMSLAQAAGQKEKPTLPKAGDFGFGIDLVPVLDYVGNMFNGTTNNTLNTFGGDPVFGLGALAPTLSIKGRYMQTDKVAYRFNFGTVGRSFNQKVYARDDAAYFQDPLSESKVIDTYRQQRSGMSFSAGIEQRRGYNRIQGYAGLDLIYGFESVTDNYSYGNALTEINQRPSRTSGFIVPPAPVAVPYWTQTYVTGRYYDGSMQYVGLGAIAGVEYFLASHLSIGGEVSLYALQMFSRQSYQKQEGFNTTTNQVETRTELLSPGNSMFSFGTENLGGKLYMMFYF
ncbi:MAG: hypothetical protein PHQ11_02790 [Paludibacter sp.]|nr:hypothetical protein [Paludibacter sp.]MDD4198175.1 hypothetical protein [Paludibacter sp.]MDD4426879.1 hypothetical protein [Paludibacter sp.]